MSNAEKQHQIRLKLLDATGRRREAGHLRETLPAHADALETEAKDLEAEAHRALDLLRASGASLDLPTTYQLAVREGEPGALSYLAREIVEKALANTKDPSTAASLRTAYSALDEAHRRAEGATSR